MKIMNGIPKVDNQKHFELINDKWTQLKEPKSTFTAILISIPLMVINLLISIWIIKFFVSVSLEDFGLNTNAISLRINLIDILALFLILITHEFIHLIFIPNFIKSKKTFIGLTYFGGYVHTEEILNRARFIIITIAPFIVISIILPIILGMLGLFTPRIIFLILLNSLGSSVDILILIFILMQVPSKAILKSNGRNTYWKTI